MFSISAVKGKFKRSKLDLEKTFLFDEQLSRLDNNILKLFKIDEKCIIYYVESDTYSWYITNQRFLIPSEDKSIILSHLKRIDFLDLKQNPSNKLKNKQLNLFTDKQEFSFYVEERSWHLIFDIFKFIIGKNKKVNG
ncbi:MAG: hypothetical protein IM568_11865 [Flavobacterium sp.]|jgi:hypothetical protein|nr:hypothetical protein [Flavobacterium sp.]